MGAGAAGSFLACGKAATAGFFAAARAEEEPVDPGEAGGAGRSDAAA